MPATVRQVVPLGSPPWPTIDPFLFCVHHVDAYPAGTERLAPAASLDGRTIGNDFAGVDGWNMYHGSVVPGFPGHPHRGFETVTFVRRGLIDHADSLGAAARFGRGDTQWLTAGGGVVHSEMFPLLDAEGPNPLELFQIWLNLPAEDKLVDPYFTMLWAEDVPRRTTGPEGSRATLTVIAGAVDDLVPPAPPPSSWASRPEADVAIWHVTLEAGAELELPPAASSETVRSLYVFEGRGLDVSGTVVDAPTAVIVDAADVLPMRASGGPAEVLVLQGRPIGEPVAEAGPFVMNTRAEVEQAFADFRRTGFGGWPWPADDPDHGPSRGRFAEHADGRVEEREPSPAS